MDIQFTCADCSKESYDTVPIMRVLEKLDGHFAKNDISGAGRLLDYWEREARCLGDDRGLIEILNEEIGFFRRIGDGKRALDAVAEAFGLVEKLHAEELPSSASVYLNGATAMRAFGKAAEAIAYYEKAYKIYENSLPQNDYRFAAYYNNASSAYKDIGDFETAELMCNSALEILEKNSGYSGEQAITHINLAHIYYDRDNFDDRIYEHMDMAGKLLLSDRNEHNGAFAFTCTKCCPSFGFFGYFDYEKRIGEIARSIYEGN